MIADTPDRGEGNPVVWQAPDGVVWLFYVNRYDETWSSSRIKAKISRDGAVTWSDSFMLTFEPGAMVAGPSQLSWIRANTSCRCTKKPGVTGNWSGEDTV